MRLPTDDIGGFSERDLTLARQISAAARELDVPADPTAVQTVQLAIDALVHPDVIPFWRAVLGYREMGDEDLVDPRGRGPSIWFQQMDARVPCRVRPLPGTLRPTPRASPEDVEAMPVSIRSGGV